MKTIELTKWSDVVVSEAARSTVAITNDHEILFLAEGFDQSPAWDDQTFRGDFTVHLVDQNRVTSIAVKDLPFVPAKLDTFEDGSVLMASKTCWKSGDDIQQNARRYSLDGECLDEFVLGDGISGLAIDDEDKIWVGYDERGVKDSHGWDEPISQSGLVAFSKTGEILFNPEMQGAFKFNALNVEYSNEVYVHSSEVSHFVHFDRFDFMQNVFMDLDVDIDGFMLLLDDEMLAYKAEKLYWFKMNKLFEYYEARDEIMLQDEHGRKLDMKNATIRMRGSDFFFIHDNGIYHTKAYPNPVL
ncbi:hypothetical protein [Jeotgalibacillus sp. R-1-5s-1]|uniref:hypothetical protein n=1 Tax=Jeotgalibacillus sp. R-1-5s-1 TaxID=2555897 RepID=UPI001069982C|nr:hypothetical protein [Jeotgalibacillus sp. R-1-5s-1]TFD99528.1 hypothetical protein E2491_07385 [Jeotgalibacillus sp. R-1-5s-1]